jgi:two-component system sensor histidine kinase/response regulator
MTLDPNQASGLLHSDSVGGGAILDPETLAALQELGGEDDPGLLEELVELFVDDASRRVESILVALDRGDVETVARAAHALKSAAANLGAFTFSHACRDLEARARQGSEITPLARRVARLFPEVTAALGKLQIS